MKRGDIIFVVNGNAVGHEQAKDRYAVVVSNDVCNAHSPVVEVVYLSTHKFEGRMPTHVVIESGRKPSVALCEAVYSVDRSQIATTELSCTGGEMEQIDRALLISLGLVASW